MSNTNGTPFSDTWDAHRMAVLERLDAQGRTLDAQSKTLDSISKKMDSLAIRFTDSQKQQDDQITSLKVGQAENKSKIWFGSGIVAFLATIAAKYIL